MKPLLNRSILPGILLACLGLILSGCGANQATPQFSPGSASVVATPNSTPSLAISPTAPVRPIVSPTTAANANTTCIPTRHGGTTTTPIDEAPVRSSVGTGHVLNGIVRSSQDCRPIEQAKIIFWLAGPDGTYDDDHRATVFTDKVGAYRFESNFPGLYGARPIPHIHLYISAEKFRPVETECFPPKGQTEGTFDIVLALQ